MYKNYLFKAFYIRNESILKGSEELHERYLELCEIIADNIMKNTPYKISQSEVDYLICTILPTPNKKLTVDANHLSYVCQLIDSRNSNQHMNNEYYDFYNDYCLLVANYANKINEIYSENKDYRKLDAHDIDYFFTILDPQEKQKEL